MTLQGPVSLRCFSSFSSGVGVGGNGSEKKEGRRGACRLLIFPMSRGEQPPTGALPAACGDSEFGRGLLSPQGNREHPQHWEGENSCSSAHQEDRFSFPLERGPRLLPGLAQS